jgi:hydroxylamine reductase (hybrid-cluster protein)
MLTEKHKSLAKLHDEKLAHIHGEAQSKSEQLNKSLTFKTKIKEETELKLLEMEESFNYTKLDYNKQKSVMENQLQAYREQIHELRNIQETLLYDNKLLKEAESKHAEESRRYQQQMANTRAELIVSQNPVSLMVWLRD